MKNLSDAQLAFKMTPTSWSVEEVVMHLAIAEPQYWSQFKESLAKPVQPEFKPQATDVSMLWDGIDRDAAHHHRRGARPARSVPGR